MCPMRDVSLILATILQKIISKISSSLKKECLKMLSYMLTSEYKYNFNLRFLHHFYMDFNAIKIASEMPVPHSLGKYFSTPRDIEVV